MPAIDIYKQLLNAAWTTLNMDECYGFDHAILSRVSMTHDDTTEFSMYLVQEKRNYMVWVVRDGRHLEYRLCSISENVYLDDWPEAMLADEIVKAFDKIIRMVSREGKQLLCEQMDREGIQNTLSLVVGEDRMDRPLRLHLSCAFSVCGQVFNGILGLEDYCRMQKDGSSPYVLKKCHSEFFLGDEYYCYNYLICKTKDDAQSWIRGFISIGDVSPLKPGGLPFTEEDSYPPLVSYAEGCGYMVLSYTK